MLNVTERAKKELKKLLTTKVDWPYAFLRLIDRGQGVLGLGIDIEAPGDNVIQYGGSKLLLVDEKLANTINGLTLDVDAAANGVELVIIEKA